MRAATRAAIVAALQANTDLSGVQIEQCWPGDQQKPESIWLNPTEGVDTTIPVFRGPVGVNNPFVIDDTFRVPVEVMVRNAGATPVAAESRVETLGNLVIATFTANPTLNSVLTPPSGWQLLDARIGSIEGPGTARSTKGAQSYMSVVIEIRARKSA